MSTLSCERAEFSAFTEGNSEPHWGIRGWVLVFCLSRPLKWTCWGTNHKNAACFLQKLSTSFPENKTQGITGKISSNLQVNALLAVTLFWYFTCVFCSEINPPSFPPRSQPLSWHQTDPALGVTAGVCSRAGKHFCCCVPEREADLELVFEAPGLRLIGQEVWFKLL